VNINKRKSEARPDFLGGSNAGGSGDPADKEEIRRLDEQANKQLARIKELENKNYDLTQENKKLKARVSELESGAGASESAVAESSQIVEPEV